MTEKTPLEGWIAGKIGGRPGEALDGEALRAYQLNKIVETLRYVREKSFFYSRLFRNLPPDPVSCLEDLSHLPFTSSDQIRDNPFHFLCTPQGEVARVVTLRSSGTTGEPKRLFFTAEDLELTVDFFGVGMSTLVRAGAKVLILLPGDKPDSVGDLLARGLERIGVEGIPHGPVKDVTLTMDRIISLGIDSLVGIPTQVLALARSTAGSIIPKGMVKDILLSTDYVPSAIVRALEELWGSRVFNHYGMTETGLGGGVECEAQRGYHLREGDLCFEVVDPERGMPLSDGEVGEVVVTTLTRRGMPLVRYRTGDMARFIPGPCPCGTTLRTMERVTGRWSGLIRVGPESRLVPAEIDEALFQLPRLLDFRITVTRQGEKDCLETEVHTDREGDFDPRQVLEALTAVKAVRDGIEGGYLTVNMPRRRNESWFTTGVAKREIIDSRGR